VFRHQLKLDVPAELIDTDLERDYATTLWESGGEDAPVR
jgi:hypothetical protein